MAVAEAMAVGLPVVSTPVACVRSVMRPGIDGIAVPPGDVEALAQGLVTLLTDEVKWDRYAKAGTAGGQPPLVGQCRRGHRGPVRPSRVMRGAPAGTPSHRERHGTRSESARARLPRQSWGMTHADCDPVPRWPTPRARSCRHARSARPAATSGTGSTAAMDEATDRGFRAAWQGASGAAEQWRYATGPADLDIWCDDDGLRAPRRRSSRLDAARVQQADDPRRLRHVSYAIETHPGPRRRRPHPRRPDGRPGPDGPGRPGPHRPPTTRPAIVSPASPTRPTGSSARCCADGSSTAPGSSRPAPSGAAPTMPAKRADPPPPPPARPQGRLAASIASLDGDDALRRARSRRPARPGPRRPCVRRSRRPRGRSGTPSFRPGSRAGLARPAHDGLPRRPRRHRRIRQVDRRQRDRRTAVTRSACDTTASTSAWPAATCPASASPASSSAWPRPATTHRSHGQHPCRRLEPATTRSSTPPCAASPPGTTRPSTCCAGGATSVRACGTAASSSPTATSTTCASHRGPARRHRASPSS